jgi:hypothetical protein
MAMEPLVVRRHLIASKHRSTEDLLPLLVAAEERVELLYWVDQQLAVMVEMLVVEVVRRLP